MATITFTVKTKLPREQVLMYLKRLCNELKDLPTKPVDTSIHTCLVIDRED